MKLRSARIYGPDYGRLSPCGIRSDFTKRICSSAYIKRRKTRSAAFWRKCPQPRKIVSMLEAVGMKMDAFYGLYTKEKLADAMLYAKG